MLGTVPVTERRLVLEVVRGDVEPGADRGERSEDDDMARDDHQEPVPLGDVMWCHGVPPFRRCATTGPIISMPMSPPTSGTDSSSRVNRGP